MNDIKSIELKVPKLCRTGEKRFKCDICDDLFASKASLLRHKLRHTGEKQYQCNICNKGFGRKDHLLKHIVIHKGEKLHQCHICKKYFGRKDYLQIHIEMHKGENLLECVVCNKGFKSNSRLTKHHQTVHNFSTKTVAPRKTKSRMHQEEPRNPDDYAEVMFFRFTVQCRASIIGPKFPSAFFSPKPS